MKPEAFQKLLGALDQVLQEAKASQNTSLREEGALLRRQRRALCHRHAQFLLLGKTPPAELVDLIVDLAKEEECRKRAASVASVLRRTSQRNIHAPSEEVSGVVERGGKEDPGTVPDASELFRSIREALLTRPIPVNQINAPCYVLEDLTYLAMPNFFKLMAHHGVVSFDPSRMTAHLEVLAGHPSVRKAPGGKIDRFIEARPGGGLFCAIAIETPGLFLENAELVPTWWRRWSYGPIREVSGLELVMRYRRGDGFDCTEESVRSEILRLILGRMMDQEALHLKGTPTDWIVQAFQGERRNLAWEALVRLRKARIIGNMEAASANQVTIVPSFLPEIRMFLDRKDTEDLRPALGAPLETARPH